MTTHSSSALDLNLRYISVRTQWGCHKISNSVGTVGDREYVMATGNRISLYDEDSGVSGTRKLLYPAADVHSVVAISVSSDKNFVSACIRRATERWKATVLVYDMESQRSYPKAPRTLIHEDGGQHQDYSFANSRFSEDSKYIACYSNRIQVGVIIYDWRVERIVSTIQTKNVISAVSFNPSNSTRLCVAGACGMFQFWHFTSKSVYSAPITGFNRTDVTYTAHTWMEQDAVVTGTDRGTLHLVVGCEAKSFHHAFGIIGGSKASAVNIPVNYIMSKGSTIVAASADGCVCVSRYTRLEGRGGITTIKLEAFFTLQDMDTITGITWADRTVESMSFAASSMNSIKIFLLPQVDNYSRGSDVATSSTGEGVLANMAKCSMLKYREGVVDVEDDDDVVSNLDVTRPPSKGDGRVSFHRATSSSAEKSTTSLRVRARWPVLMAQRQVTCFHSEEIKSLCSTPRCSMLASLSVKDCSVRIWDYNRVNESNVITEDFSQRLNELPNFLDMHPSGLSLAAGSDDYVTEYAITDCKLEVLKRIPVKVAITSPNGEPVMNTSPVSIVKFSNGGHLLAVVTGRLAQIFEVYHYSYNTEKNGVPDRLMTMNDHMANITDITFTRDDRNIYTCGSDGAVYEWTVDRNTISRDNDYVMKNVGATRVAVSPSRSCIMASFEVESTIRSSHTGRMNSMKSFSRQNSDAEYVSSAAHSPAIGNERRSGLILSRENSSHQPLAQMLLNRTTSTGSEAPTTDRGFAGPTSKAFIVFWTEGKIQSTKESILELTHPVTAISFGMLDGRDEKEICVMGLSNGDVVISLLPIPLKVMTDFHIDPACDVRYMTINSMSRDINTPTKRGGRLLSLDSGDLSDGADHPGTPAGGTLTGDATPLTSGNAADGPREDEKVSYTFDETLCRVFSLHEGAVTRTFVSASGLWIFTSGVDGTIFMLNTNLKAKEQIDVAEAYGHENHIVLTDKAMLKSQQSRIEDKDAMLEEMAKEKKHTVQQLENQRESEKKVLEETMVREIAKRDDIILLGRTELQQANKKAAEKLEHTHKQYRTQLAELEVMYEKKLAHESLYLENMKQAYDEYVTHARMDLEAFHRKAGIREERLNVEKEEILEETEKQKKLLLEYCDYVGQRHREVLQNLSEAHDDQKYALNLELQKQTGVIEAIRNQTRQDEAKALRQMQLLRSEMSAKELEALNTAQELERMKDRSHRLETALQNALEEISRKTEAANKWEFKAGEQQQQLSELERVRKALVSQLHSLREEMGPKEMQIVKTSERLNEVDREYERSLKSVSEKEMKLTQSSNMLHLLHKQVRELRSTVIQKEGSLKRAAKLLDEFKYALQQARFESRKITVPGGVAGLVDRDRVEDTSMISADGFPRVHPKKGHSKKDEVLELISSTPVMEESLQRLHDVLNPHATDEEVTDDNDKLVIAEKERQIDLMRRNINSLRTNIKFGESVATKKVHNFLTDNEHLLYEMNALRNEIGHLREENERLHATYDMYQTRRQASKASIPKQKGRNIDSAPVNSLLPEFPLKRTDSEKDGLDDSGTSANGHVSMSAEEMLVRSLGQNDSLSRKGHTASGTIRPTGNKSRGHVPEEGEEEETLEPKTISQEHSHSSAESGARYNSRADKLIQELMASNSQRIRDQAVERDQERAKLLKEAKSTIPLYYAPTGKDKKAGNKSTEFTLKVGPAARNTTRSGHPASPGGGKSMLQKKAQSASTSALPRL